MSQKATQEKQNARKVERTESTPVPEGLPELDKGWVYHDLRNSKGVYAGERKDVTQYSFREPVWAPIPVDAEAQAAVLEKYATPLSTPAGEIAVDGLQGIVARQMVSNYETIRGRFAELAAVGNEVTHAMIQKAILDHALFGGRRGGIRKVEVSEDRIARLAAKGDTNEILAYLRAQGAKIS